MQIKLIPVPSEEEDDFYDLEKDFSSGDEETEEPPSVSASVLLEEFENDADLEKVFLPSQSEPISESPDILIPVDQVISVEEVPLAAPESPKEEVLPAYDQGTSFFVPSDLLPKSLITRPSYLNSSTQSVPYVCCMEGSDSYVVNEIGQGTISYSSEIPYTASYAAPLSAETFARPSVANYAVSLDSGNGASYVTSSDSRIEESHAYSTNSDCYTASRISNSPYCLAF
eukprot:TRINITY_DN1595_c0_g1_i1.p1 TRINITY_DN1595_c0_g1~~TRINITY_DN1595_c0_g1_i1.p1  ORF type:complete len:228 (-),score=47.63 TRINITY_DN1595_c0_g1_i1:51-734(-)